MNKLYNTEGNLIGYKSDEIIERSATKLFLQACKDMQLKLRILGVDVDTYESVYTYYIPLVKKYKPIGIIIGKNGNIYFKNTTICWIYKPLPNNFGTISLFNRVKTKYLELQTLDVSKVTNFSWMFRDSTIKELDISNFNTISGENMEAMFCNLKTDNLNLSSFNTSNVKSMAHMFSMCSAKVLNLSSFDTSKVTNMLHMFDSCYSKDIQVSTFDTSKVTNMKWMFYKCNLKKLDLSSFTTESLDTVEGMFRLSKIEELDLSHFTLTDKIYCKDMFSESVIGSILLNSTTYNRLKHTQVQSELGLTPEAFSKCEVV